MTALDLTVISERNPFNARVRHPDAADEIVECENMSKGGLCFHNRKEYPVGALIELAAPFSPGEPALFVSAQIKRADPLPGTQVICCRVHQGQARSTSSVLFRLELRSGAG